MRWLCLIAILGLAACADDDFGNERASQDAAVPLDLAGDQAMVPTPDTSMIADMAAPVDDLTMVDLAGDAGD